MANEFKIRKGLIVEGASGGTVVDVQGSQGQLFSVTDDLSGSIFAVSDISGVPILDVNSSGLSTFSGNVTIGSVDTSVGEGLNIGNASPTIQLFDTTNDAKLLLYTQDSSSVIGTYSNHPLNLFTNSTLALTLDISQNATFAADVTVSGNIDVSGEIIQTSTGNENSFSSELNMGSNKINSLANPTAAQDAATKAYVDAHGGGLGPFLPLTAGSGYPLTDTLYVQENGNKNNGTISMGLGGSGTSKWSFLTGTHYNQATGSGNGSGSAGMAIIGALATETYNKVYIGGGPYEINAATQIDFWTHSDILSTQGGTRRGYVDNGGNWFLADTLWVDAADEYVGIGTTSPSAKLNVVGTATLIDSASQITVNNATYTEMQYGPSNYFRTDGGQAIINGPIITFKIGGTEKMRIDSSGNVGIGTTDPAVKLDFGSATGKAFHLYTSGVDYYGFNMLQYDSGPFSTNIIAGNGGEIKLRTVSGSSTQSTRLTVKAAGNVGIGTTSPEDKLEVSGGSLKIKTVASATLAPSIKLGRSDQANGNFENHISSQTGSGASQCKIEFKVCDTTATGRTTLLSLDGGNNRSVFQGYVGIGTTSPSETLEVSGKVRIFDGGYPYIDLGVSTSNYFRIIHDNPNDILKIGKNGATTSSSLIVQGGTGNVGIGGVPGSRFDVQGTQGQLFSVTDDLSGDIFSVADISGVPIMNVNSNGTIQFSDLGAGTLVTDANGNISVSSGGGAGGPYLPLSGGTMTGITQFNDHTQHGDQVSAKWGTGNDLTIKHNATDSFFENNTGHLNIVNYANDKDIVLWNDDGTGGIAKYLVLNGNSTHAYFSNPGNVGIGTTSPGFKLEVDTNGVHDGIKIRGANAPGLTLQDDSSDSISTILIQSTAAAQGNLRIAADTNNVATGATIEFQVSGSERMRINSLGDVGIGTTSPNAKLDVQSSTTGNLLARVYNPNTGTSSSATFRIASSANNANSASLQFSDSTAYTATISGDRVQGLVFRTSASGSNPITIPERMRITPTGNVGIGTTSPSSKLEVNGDIDTTGSNGYLINGMAWALENSGVLTLGDWDGNEFSTRIMDENSNEVLRVTGGRVGIGTTSPLATLHIDNPQTANGNIGMISDASAGGTGTRNIHVNLPNYGEGIRFLRSGTYSGGAMKFYSGSSNVGSVQINASSTSFNTTSDYRAKENIVAMENSINRLKELKPCRFNFLIDPENTVDGFIAHEAQEVVPEAITGEKDKLDYEGNPEYQGIDQSKLVPLLTSALQEAISKIEQLETRIQTLENN